jgi:hypothetical protein
MKFTTHETLIIAETPYRPWYAPWGQRTRRYYSWNNGVTWRRFDGHWSPRASLRLEHAYAHEQAKIILGNLGTSGSIESATGGETNGE